MIDIRKIKYFDAAAIADSGQVFRADIKSDGVHFISGGEYAVVCGGEIISTNDSYFTEYFDLTNEYENAVKTIKLPQKIKNSCGGIRILQGNITEIIISFIISANNNIKRIKKTVAALCEKYGEVRTRPPTDTDYASSINYRPPTDTYRAFPALDALARITAAEFKAMGCGYRAEYLVKTVKTLQTADLTAWKKLDNDGLYRQIIKLHGVGDKVARCIMLFAFHRLDIVPVDTWIIKTAGNFVDIKGKTPKTVAAELQKYFGQFGGIAQQYIFYYTQFLKQNLKEAMI